MLKYQINKGNLHSDLIQLPIENYKMYENNSQFNEDMNVELEYKTKIDAKIGDKVRVLMELTPEDYYGNTEYYDKEFTIQNIDLTNNKLLISMPRYINLNLDYFIEQNGNSKNEFIWTIKFKEKHFFYEDDNNINVKFIYYKNGSEETYTLNKCNVIDEYTLAYYYNEEKDGEVSKYIFNTNEKPRGNTQKMMIKYFKRNHYFITHNVKYLRFFIKRYQIGICVPFTNTHDISTTKQFDVNERFVAVEKEKIISKPIEMEKNIFVPVCKFWDNGTRDNTEKTEDVFKINFNLHLRYHHGKDWQVNDEDFWNGVHKNKLGKWEINEDYFAVPYVEDGNRDKLSWQPDLLCNLGFNDADVRYQKSRLKKTFLRLSFYDSPNPGSQNLITYSTIFLDSNKLSGKMIRNSSTRGYKQYDHMNDKISLNLEGVRTTRDINFKTIDNKTLTTNNCEEYRLSSQFSVMDKYTNTDCSEGFYLYLWKDFTEGTIPNDLYLKIELNHAAYGRTIPLMMPYFAEKGDDSWDGQTADGKSWGVYRNPIEDDKLKEGESNEEGQWYGIKSFYDIVNDWNNGGYNIERFLKYSYIHLKCQFDKEKNRYIYYLDNLFYENCHKIFDIKNGVLNINLYEAKVCESNITSANIEQNIHSIELTKDFKIKIIDSENTTKEEIDLNRFKTTSLWFCDKNGYVYKTDNNQKIDKIDNSDISYSTYNEYWYITDSGKKQYCDKNGYVLDKNESDNIYFFCDDNGNIIKGDEETNGYYTIEYKQKQYYCDERGYILDLNIDDLPYKLNDREICYGENNEYGYTTDGTNYFPCDKNGYVYVIENNNKVKKLDCLEQPLHVYDVETVIDTNKKEFNVFKIYDVKGSEITSINFDETYHYLLPLKDSKGIDINYYDIDGNKITFEDGCFIVPKYNYKCSYRQIDNKVKINCLQNGYIQPYISNESGDDIINEHKFYICKQEYITHTNAYNQDEIDFERNFNKIINYIKNTTITYDISYTLNKENELWDNYYTTQNYDNNILEDIHTINNGDNCRVRINFFDKDKNNVLKYYIYPITNQDYKDYLINNNLNILDLRIEAIYDFAIDQNNNNRKQELLKSLTSTTIDKELNETENNDEDDNERPTILTQETEFIYYEKIPKETTISFLIRNTDGQIMQNGNLKYVLNVINKLSNNKYVDDFYLTQDKSIESYTVAESNNSSIYNKKLTIKWKNINRQEWKHWKFCIIEIVVKKDDDEVITKERLYFTFFPSNSKKENFYYIKSQWFTGWYQNQKNIESDEKGNVCNSTKLDSINYPKYKDWKIYDNKNINLVQRLDKDANEQHYKLINTDGSQLSIFRHFEDNIPMGYYYKIKKANESVKVFCTIDGEVLINTKNDYRKYRNYSDFSYQSEGEITTEIKEEGVYKFYLSKNGKNILCDEMGYQYADNTTNMSNRYFVLKGKTPVVEVDEDGNSCYYIDVKKDDILYDINDNNLNDGNYYNFGDYIKIECNSDGKVTTPTRLACDDLGRLYVRNIDMGDENYSLIKDFVKLENNKYTTPYDNRFQKLPHTATKTSFYFIAFNVSLKWNNKINYECNYTFPNLSDFNVKMIGVQSYDVIPVLSDRKEIAPFKVGCTLKPQFCSCCTTSPNSIANQYYGNKIYIWIKSTKFETLTSSINQQVESIGYLKNNELNYKEGRFNSAIVFEPYDSNSTNQYYIQKKKPITECTLKKRRFLKDGSELYDIVYNENIYKIIRTQHCYDYQTTSTLNLEIKNIHTNEMQLLNEHITFDSSVIYKIEDYYNVSFSDVYIDEGLTKTLHGVKCLCLTRDGKQALEQGKKILFSIQQEDKCESLNKKIYLSISQ